MNRQGRHKNRAHQFGTFGGVFTPSILTILGVILFMRANFVVGQGGIMAALLILAVGKSITLLTGLSLSAISTNSRVRGGGAYFLISRSLGPEFGGAIGLALFFAQALSVPFYILGFVEALVQSIPALEGHFLFIALCTASLLFVVAYVGADWAIRVQYVILAVMALSIFTFLAGALGEWNSATFSSNLGQHYSSEQYDFWVIFAIYFPAVTGIMAGVNMSGDLKDPGRSIPLGTLTAIGAGVLVYVAQILICGGAYSREQLVRTPFQVLFENALFGLGFLVIAGVFAATLSSAIGSFLGAPRILQALARDHVFSFLDPFAKGAPKGNEPRRALCLTFGITMATLLYSGNDAGGGALNTVAALITMFFLYTYGIINVAAFVESVTANPSFRPRFRYFHWATALVGALGCVATTMMINPQAAIIAVVIIGAIFFHVSRRVLSMAFGDARRGFHYTRVRNELLMLAARPADSKNWRPTVLVLSGNPETRLALVRYALWLASQRGLVTLAEVFAGNLEEMAQLREAALRRLQAFIEEHEIAAFPEVVVAQDFDQGAIVLLQGHSIGPIKPNIMLLGWPGDPERLGPFTYLLRSAQAIGMSIVCVLDRELPWVRPSKRIDVWWRGLQNGSLMLILAYLLTLNGEWTNARIRILRVVGKEAGRAAATRALDALSRAARISADVEIVVSEQPFKEVLKAYSHDAAVVFLGFQIPDGPDMESFPKRYSELAEGLPTTLLIYSSGEADLTT
ncbi:MAG: amino acid permease [Thermodesulfobacteriota bacterium]|nr:amino acid permease [Thermodesulfobacteriota bacterium]